MKWTSFLFLCFLPLCSHAQKKVTISGHIPALINGSKIYLVRLDGRLDSAVTENGRFRMVLDIPYGDGYRMLANDEQGHHYSNQFFLDEGAVQISASGPLFGDVQLSGNSSFVKEYLGWKQQEAADSLLKQEGPTRYEARFANYERWILAHPRSPLSTYIVARELFKRYYPEKWLPLVDALKGPATETGIYQRLQQSAATARITAVGQVAPDFTISDSTGKPISLSSFRGKYVLIDFWASWCAPCRAENPHVLQAYQKLGARNFTVLGISLDDDRHRWLQAVKEDGMPWTQVCDFKAFNGKAAKLFDLVAIPSNFLIGPDGKILSRTMMGADLDKQLEHYIR